MYFQLIQKPNLIGSYVRVVLYLTETCVKQQYFHLSVFRFSSFEALVLSNWIDGRQFKNDIDWQAKISWHLLQENWQEFKWEFILVWHRYHTEIGTFSS